MGAKIRSCDIVDPYNLYVRGAPGCPSPQHGPANATEAIDEKTCHAVPPCPLHGCCNFEAVATWRVPPRGSIPLCYPE